MPTARRVLLSSYPTKEIKLENFRFDEQELPALQDGELLLKPHYLSVDPYMREKLKNEKDLVPPFQLNEPLDGVGVGEVVESKSPKFGVGDIISGYFKFQTLVIVSPQELAYARLVPSEIFPTRQLIVTVCFAADSWNSGIRPSNALSIAGMVGVSGYCGFLEICQPKETDTVVVSGGAGAVGSVVGQIAKIKNCKNVVGIAGSEEKLQYMKDLGYDHVVNYKSGNLDEQLAKACPEGIDAYFDNVGGEISDAVIKKLNVGARVALCGSISQYNERTLGPRHEGILIGRSIKMQGFIMGRDFGSKVGEAFQQLEAWVKEGKMKIAETVLEGIDNVPQALIDIMTGKNIGKQLVKL